MTSEWRHSDAIIVNFGVSTVDFELVNASWGSFSLTPENVWFPVFKFCKIEKMAWICLS